MTKSFPLINSAVLLCFLQSIAKEKSYYSWDIFFGQLFCNIEETQREAFSNLVMKDMHSNGIS